MKKDNHLLPNDLSQTGVSRRRFFGQSGSVVATFALGSLNATTALAAQPAPTDATTLNQFLKLSRFLTGHQNLATTLGERLWTAFTQQSAGFSSQMEVLQNLIGQHKLPDVEALDTLIKGQPLHDVMMAVIRGWYLGVTDDSHHARVYAYQNALMYQVPRDGMVIPTYAHNGPDYWTSEPPPVGRLLTF